MEEISYDDTSLLDLDVSETIELPVGGDNAEGVPMTSTPKRRIKCTECRYTTSSRGNMSRHKRTTHRKERFQCGQCSKSFGALYDLKQHLRSIYTQTQLLCEMCSKQFNCRTSLARHRAVKHASTSKYTCEQCRKGFYERSSFIGHMNAHNGLQTVHMQ